MIEFSEDSILDVLNRQYLSNPKYLINRLFVFGWESDYLAKTTAGYWYEVEVKISVSDFKADFKKVDKHIILEGTELYLPSYSKLPEYAKRKFGEKYRVENMKKPNYFSYCVPRPLVEKVAPLVPPYAGLLSVSEHGFLEWHKAPPKLHSLKLSDTELRLMDKFYYNWVEEKRKNRNHDKIVRDLKGQIAFLKEEFKNTTGYSIDEIL